MKKLVATIGLLVILATNLTAKQNASDLTNLLYEKQEEMTKKMSDKLANTGLASLNLSELLIKTKNDQAQFFAENLNDEEIEKMTEFFKSEIGKKFLKTQADFAEKQQSNMFSNLA